MWNWICKYYIDSQKLAVEKKKTVIKLKEPKTKIHWIMKNKYKKLLYTISIMFENKNQRLHLENGIILDFKTMTIYKEDI